MISKKTYRNFVSVALFMVLSLLPSDIRAESIVGSINDSSLINISSKPTFYGSASGTKIVKVQIYKEGSKKKIFSSKTIKVKDNKWKLKVSKKLLDGNYEMLLFGTSKTSGESIDRELFSIGKKEQSKFEVKSVPLLFGGVTTSGKTIPVSYLQITNNGDTSETLNGFWVKQNGNAPADVIVGLTTVDDRGGSRGYVETTKYKSLFNNNLAFVPTNLTFAPGEMRLFTIKAILDNNAYSYSGKQISIDVDAIEFTKKFTAGFPIKGTTWVIGK